MCDTGKISGLLAGARGAYFGMLATLGIAILNSSSFFAAATNIAVMAVAITLNLGAIAMNAAALYELDKCAGSCAEGFSQIRGSLIAVISALSASTALLIASAIVAAIPFAGAVSVASTLGLIVGGTAGFIASFEGYLAHGISTYNTCRVSMGMSSISDAILVICYAVLVASLIFGGIVLVIASKYT